MAIILDDPVFDPVPDLIRSSSCLHRQQGMFQKLRPFSPLSWDLCIEEPGSYSSNRPGNALPSSVRGIPQPHVIYPGKGSPPGTGYIQKKAPTMREYPDPDPSVPVLHLLRLRKSRQCSDERHAFTPGIRSWRLSTARNRSKPAIPA